MSDKKNKDKMISSNNKSSFLQTISSTEMNNLISNNNTQKNDMEEIYVKYINLKKKINILWNKFD